MRKKIPIDMASGMGLKNRNDSIFTSQNKYGYQINIGHPAILPLYEEYKRQIGERILSDAQRLAFESMIFQKLHSRNDEGKEV